jgi:DNA-binding transcriptional ArsR family regulator
MVNYQRNLDATFGALADPTRRAILAALTQGQASVTELARPHRMSLPAVMKHLSVLQKAGLVTQRKVGRSRRCRLVARPLENAEAWISQYRAFWDKQFDSLDRYLTEQKSTDQTAADRPPQEAPKWPKNKRHPRRHSH